MWPACKVVQPLHSVCRKRQGLRSVTATHSPQQLCCHFVGHLDDASGVDGEDAAVLVTHGLLPHLQHRTSLAQ